MFKPLGFVLCVVSLFIYSCSRNPLLNDEYRGKVLVFNSQPTMDTTHSRATQTSWESGDQIGVFMVRQSAPGVWETIVDKAFNKCYQTSGDGLFTPATVDDEIHAPDDQAAVSFVVYYPYRSDLLPSTPCLYSLDLIDQTDLSQTNFMVSRNLEDVVVGSDVLNLNFEKPLSRLRINVRSDFEAARLEGMSLVIRGLKHSKADYSLLNSGNKLVNAGNDGSDIEAIVSSLGDVAESSVLAEPNVLASGSSFIFRLKDGTEITYAVSDELKFKSGRRYTYNIRLSDNGATDNYLEVLPQSVDGVKLEGETTSVSLLSQKSWTLHSAPDWVTCSPSSGIGGSVPQQISLTFDINNSQNLVREGEVVFQDSEGALVSVSVSQEGYPSIGYEAYIRYGVMYNKLPDVVLVPSYNIPAELLKWDYYSTTMWNAKIVIEPSDWIRFSYPSWSRQYVRPHEEVTFTIENNNSSQSREMLVKLVDYDSVLIHVYKVVQQGAADYLEVSQSKFNSRGKGDRFDFVVTSRDEWQAENVPDWVTLNRGPIVANKTSVNIICAANQGAARSANIVLRSGSLTYQIEVSQNAKRVQSYPFRLSYSAIVHAFAGPGFKFVGSSQGTNNYANTADIVVRPGDGITSESVTASNNPYGFVVDPPASTEFKSPPVSGKTMVLPSYMGNQTTVREVEVGIHYNGWTYIRRAKVLDMPVPAGLTDEDQLLYTIKLTDIVSNNTFKYSVSYEIK